MAEEAPTQASASPPARSPTRSPPGADQQQQQQQQQEAETVAHQAVTTIEAGDDSDDGYGTEVDSRASTSISSSVRDYAFEHGRRYHSFRAGKYQFPNDDAEQEREDMKHAMIVNLCGGKLHYAPLKNPQNILDIGTGTGIWAIDAGDEFPSAQILGIDLSPIQPSWVPPNVKFMVDDAESPWLHPPNTFDFVHARHMCSSIKNWPKLLEEAHDKLQPGGWIELQDLEFQAQCDDGTLKETYEVSKLFKFIAQGLAVFGIDLLGIRKNAELLRDAGFINVEEKIFKIPIGTWPKHKTMKTIGLYMRSSIYDGLQAITLGPFTRGLKWSVEDVELFLVQVRRELMDSSTHAYIPFHVVYGQKAPSSS